MPFKSKKQTRWMFAEKPEMAHRWAHHTPDIKSLPEAAQEEEKKGGILSTTARVGAKYDLIQKLVSKRIENKTNRQNAAGNRLLDVINPGLKSDPSFSHQEPDDTKTASEVSPPHLRPSDQPGESCAACQHFDPTASRCLKYGSMVQPHQICDDFEAIDIDMKAIEKAGPVQPVQPIMPHSSGPNFSSIKLGRAKRPDRFHDMSNWLTRIHQHPDTHSGSMIAPMHAMYDAMDRPRHPALEVGEHPQNRMENHDSSETSKKMDERRMTTKEAFKTGFLLRCAEEGLTLDQLEKRVDQLLEKSAEGFAETVGSGARGLIGAAGSGLGWLLDKGTTAAVGAPLLAGGLLGYGAAKWKNSPPDPDDLQHNQLRNEYLRLADAARRKALLKKVQEEEPGSVVQIG